MRPYVIVTPDFAHVCAGITTLHKLCQMLNERGYIAYTTGRKAGPAFPEFNLVKSTHDLSKEEAQYLQYNGVVVYPDIAPGNPLRFTNVVRWWVGIPQYVPEKELVVSLAENHDHKVKVEDHLCIWHTEKKFQPPEVENRDRTCFIVHKGGWIPRRPETNPPCVEIASQFSRDGLIDLLQHSSILYSYDDCTLLTVESRLCGCPAQIFDYTSFTKESLATSSFSTFAMTFPGEKVDMVKLRDELPLFYNAYRERELKTERELDVFIEKTQTMNFPYVENPLHEQAPQTWLPWNQFGVRI